jgi:hypothetical protein
MSLPAKRFSKVDRYIAFGLAFLWIAASVIGIAMGVLRGRWTVILVSLLGLGYGVVWLRAARLGRRVRFKEALWPSRQS